MELAQIIEEARRRMDDEVEPYFISDTALINWANEAEREASERARLLYDQDAGPITEIPVEPGRAQYPLDPRVQLIVGASFQRDNDLGWRKALDLRGLDWIEERDGSASRTASRPEALADDGRRTLHLWPTPSMAGVLRLAVYRDPLERMEVEFDEPEIEERHHEGLVDWMLYRAWSRPDAESGDDARAARALADFERRFGASVSAGVRRKHRERRRITTRYGGL